jgi:hypothetical protein
LPDGLKILTRSGTVLYDDSSSLAGVGMEDDEDSDNQTSMKLD